ncbi:MAG: hypothetical protein NTW66_01765 [Candidatus Magasanikbacteria bacterium]|nr:hypothetical protein [Candidatus Magasanikbacteria bacterium]
MDNTLRKSLFSSGKLWLVSAITVIIFIPTVTLAKSSEVFCSYTSLDHYLAMYYKQNKVKELKTSQKGEDKLNLAQTAEKTKVAIVPAKNVAKTQVINQLEKQIIVNPAKKTVSLPVAGQKSAGSKPDRVVNAVITAYTSTPDQTDDTPDIAASGKHVYDGMIAANWLPFGTQIKIPALYGDKIFTVDDRMNRRYGYGRMDVWLDTSKSEALKFGVKRVEIEVYNKVKTKQLVLAK